MKISSSIVDFDKFSLLSCLLIDRIIHNNYKNLSTIIMSKRIHIYIKIMLVRVASCFFLSEMYMNNLCNMKIAYVSKMNWNILYKERQINNKFVCVEFGCFIEIKYTTIFHYKIKKLFMEHKSFHDIRILIFFLPSLHPQLVDEYVKWNSN